MTDQVPIARRRLVAGMAGAGITTLLAGCDRLASDAGVNNALGRAEDVSRRIQGLVTARQALAREFTEADISRVFKSNGTSGPDDDEYQAFAGNNFADWRLDIGGLVERPMKLALADLGGMPSRTQITRHDCVEGWSCIGKWKGAVLSDVLQRVRLQR